MASPEDLGGPGPGSSPAPTHRSNASHTLSEPTTHGGLDISHLLRASGVTFRQQQLQRGPHGLDGSIFNSAPAQVPYAYPVPVPSLQAHHLPQPPPANSLSAEAGYRARIAELELRVQTEQQNSMHMQHSIYHAQRGQAPLMTHHHHQMHRTETGLASSFNSSSSFSHMSDSGMSAGGMYYTPQEISS